MGAVDLEQARRETPACAPLRDSRSSVIVLVARRLRGILQRPTARLVLDRITGTVVAGFGVKLAASSR